nr:FtsK/SpoIIIE domain-containing protein [Streptomyces sp. x4(2010)]
MVADPTKSAWKASRAATVNALDALTPTFAPFAARWDAEADRRKALRTPENLKRLMEAQRAYSSARSTAAQARSQRTAARRASKNPLSAERRAARTADRAARQEKAQARAKLKEARAHYPATLTRVAVQAHAAHAVPAAALTYAMQSPWPATTSGLLAALNGAALWLGRRQPRTVVGDGLSLSAEERRLAERLDPSYWVQHADERGLSGTVPSPVQVTPAGLVSHVRLDGRWTPRTFAQRLDEVRALLGARSDLRIEITRGSHGDRATITLRTRSAADGVDLSGWEPGAPWGVDTVTGEPVHVPLGRRVLVAGTSGAGKSWSTRAILAEASETEDHRLVVIDPKRVEAVNWQHRARVAVTPDEVLQVTDELYAEMIDREQLIPRGQDVIAISAARPRITVFVDEGAEVIAMAKAKGYDRIIENLRSIARRARAAEIILIWATQKPTMSGDGHGIDSQIAGQITYRASLALSSAGESRVVFGDDAHERGWHAHDLPMPGYALLRSHPKAKPHHIRTRAMSPQDVIALPDRPIWRREIASAAPPGERPALRLVKDEAPASTKSAAETPAIEGLTDNQLAVLRAVEGGASTNAAIAKATGLNPGSVDRAVKALVKRGLIVKDGTEIRMGGAA